MRRSFYEYLMTLRNVESVEPDAEFANNAFHDTSFPKQEKDYQKLSEYHTGYRAFSVEVLKNINYENNSDDFVFDNQMLAQIFYAGYEIAEITCPTKYFKEASSINFRRSVKYGFGVLSTSFKYFFNKIKITNSDIFKTNIKNN